MILDTIADSLRKISDFSDRYWLNDLANNDTKKETFNGWDKIPEVIQQMILKLSSVNNSSFAPGPY